MSFHLHGRFSCGMLDRDGVIGSADADGTELPALGGVTMVADQQADAVPQDGRDETQNERMDRNWNELLQELRVTQTGTQILSGFLLTLVFQPRFASLDSLQRSLYVALVLLAAATIVLGLAPVNLHRALFRQQLKPSIVRFGHLALRFQLAGVALIVLGTVLLILDVGLGRRLGLIGAAGTLALVLVAAAVPFFFRHERRGGSQGGRRDLSPP